MSNYKHSFTAKIHCHDLVQSMVHTYAVIITGYRKQWNKLSVKYKLGLNMWQVSLLLCKVIILAPRVSSERAI